jgi:3-mercaptopyruvate sulfurtransferase SseA
VALLLKRSGARWVHPLHGGLAGWIDAGFPVEALTLADEAERAS